MVEPGLIRVSPDNYSAAKDHRVGSSWSRQDFVNRLARASVLTAVRLDAAAPAITPARLDAWLDEFARPIYIRDVGASVIGPIWETPWLDDMGPGDPRVLDGGAAAADTPTFPRTGGPRR